MEQVLVTQHCTRCNHEWMPRKAKPITCPHCRSPYWNIPKDGIDLDSIVRDASGEVLFVRVDPELLRDIDKKVARSKYPSRTEWLLWVIKEGLRDRHGKGDH